MQGQMINQPLLISSLIYHAESVHGSSEIVSRRCEGDIHRYTMAEAILRSKQLANILSRLGIRHGDRIASLAWNNYRHFEMYFGVSGYGAVLHTINPRLFNEQLVYIINHAEDRYIFVDLTFVPLLEALKDQITGVEGFVILCDADHMPDTSLPNALCYETLLAAESDQFNWPELDEEAGASLCYTSGTTGHPKGVLYTHRSTVLHAQSAASTDVLSLSNLSCFIPVVPMFHVNAWGTPYAAAITGAKQVFPGPGLAGEPLWEMIDSEQPDLLLGVPTVWSMLLQHMQSIDKKLESVEQVVIGGSAAPLSMIQEFQEQHDAFVVHAWGMTEMSPIGSINCMTRAMLSMTPEQRYQVQMKQGRPVYGVEMKIINDKGDRQPHDGKSFGRLMVRGPWIIDSYYKQPKNSALEDGWFDTGDVATLDSDGYMQIVDRSKDVIKSGGEWISSIDLENTAVSHPEVIEACVIGARHPKWEERPVMLAVKKPGSQLDEASMRDFLDDKVAKWWMPDAIIFVDSLPHTATGKLLKIDLRKTYENILMA